MNCIYLKKKFYNKINILTATTSAVFLWLFVLSPHLLEIKFGHRLQKSLLPFLCSQLQNFLRVTGVQLCLTNCLHLQETRIGTHVPIKEMNYIMHEPNGWSQFFNQKLIARDLITKSNLQKIASTQNRNVSIIKLYCSKFHCVQRNKRVWKNILVLIV